MQAGQDNTITLQTLSLPALWKTFRTKVIGRKFVQDIGVLTVGNFAGAALGFVQIILVTRWLGPEQYGVAALVMSYPALLYGFLDARSSIATVKYLGEFRAKGESSRALAMCKLGYGLDLTIALMTFLLVAVTASWAGANVVHMPNIAPLILIYAVAFFPRALVGTSRAVLSVFGRFNLLAWTELFTTALRVAVILGLVLSGWGVAGVIWGNAVGMVASGVLLAMLAYPLVWRAWGTSWLSGSWRELRGQRREILRFLFFMDLSELLGLFVKQFDIVTLGYFRGPQEAGYYRLAKSLARIASYLVGPLQSVSFPRLALLAGAGKRSELKEIVKKLAFWVGLPFGAVGFGGILLVPWVMPLLVGPSFAPATVAAQLLMAGSAVWITFFWLRPLYVADGRIGFWTALSLACSVLSIVLYPIAATWLGLDGVAASWLAIVSLRYGVAILNVFQVTRKKRNMSHEVIR